MNNIFLKARAKINLAIDVCGKRPDGYHDLRMVMQTVSLYDGVYIKKINRDGYLKLVSNISYLPNDHKNLAFKAVEAMREHFGVNGGVFVQLNKRIPVSAGLAGGSSDCAAALVGMRNLFELPATTDELMLIGKSLGADVPFCVMRGTALAEGIGDRLKRLSPLPQAFALLAKPPVIVSTSDIFKAFSFDKVKQRPDIEKMLFYLENGDLKGVCGQMANSLETVTASRYPVIREIKDVMLENGALGALMSGSGPAVFGIFETRERAAAAKNAVSAKFPTLRDVFIVRTFNTF